MPPGPTSVRLRAAGHAAAALLAIGLLPPLASLGTLAAVLAAGLFVLACWRPAASLLIVAALFPLTPIALPMFGVAPSAADGMLTAVLGGAFAHAAFHPSERRAPQSMAFAAAALAVVIVASMGVQVALEAVRTTPAGLRPYLLDLWRTFYVTPVALVAGVQAVAFAALAVVSARVASDPQERQRLIRMTLAGGIAVGCLSVGRALQIALRTATGLSALPRILTSVRISRPFSDPNAAGSYYVMLLVPAVLIGASARGRSRAAWLAAAAVLAFGLWTSGSRAAVLVALGTLAVAGTLRQAPRLRTRLLAAGGAAAAIALVLLAFPNPILTRTVSSAIGIRAEMARVAVKLWETDPWIGVGAGTFYDRSAEFITDPLVKNLYGRENAHNNFLQILAELGLLGLFSFGLVLWSASPRARDIDPVSAGLGAFLLTCLAGHPLLLRTVAVPFWILVGVAAARSAEARDRRVARVLAIAIALATIAAVYPSYRTERARMNLEHLGSGVSAWEIGADGVRFRTMTGSARVFAPRATGQIAIPLRASATAALPVTVSIMIEGQPADRLEISTDWRIERLQVPSENGPAFLSVDIEARDARGRPADVDVGRVNAVDVR